MSRSVLFPLACLTAGIFLGSPSQAQSTNRFNFHVGGGFTQPVQKAEGRVDLGWNAMVGGGVNFSPHTGIMAEFGFQNMDLTQRVLRAAGAPAGTTRVYSATLNPIIRFNPRGRFDSYAVGGGGFYRRTLEFTEPTIDVVTGFDPFYGVFFPVNVPSNIVLGSFSQNKGGLNIGAGVSFRVRGDSNAKFFAEARYHYIYTTPVRTTLLPVTFGFRW
ncbi:MAG TPA: outer membrane beta-barrel protein [Bryobacteraceae bacterium]|nr:outer membrane beta-barrel protein [Bryobacteraceae bacterium]